MVTALEAYHKAIQQYRSTFRDYQETLRKRFALEGEAERTKKLEDRAFDKLSVAQRRLEKARAKYEDELSKTLPIL